jgi:hypothetical protein
MRTSRLAVTFSCLWLSLAGFSHADNVILYDGTFNSSDWSLTTFGTDSGHTITLSQQTSGGNPGDYQQMQFYLSSDSSTDVVGLAFYTAETYNPHANGAITSIDFSEDHFQTADLVGSFVLMQSGIIYVFVPPVLSSGTFAPSWLMIRIETRILRREKRCSSSRRYS